MKLMKKLAALVFVFVTLFTTVLPVGAMAASKTYKGSSSTSYTITTGRKSATLTVSPSKGTRAQKYVKKSNTKKTHIDKWSSYGQYKVTVNGKTYIITSKSQKITLPANGTYRVSVSCTGVSGYGIRADYKPFTWKKTGSQYWYKSPSIKLSVNHSAKIR